MTLHLLCKNMFLPLWSTPTKDLEMGIKIKISILAPKLLHFYNVGWGAKISFCYYGVLKILIEN